MSGEVVCRAWLIAARRQLNPGRRPLKINRGGQAAQYVTLSRLDRRDPEPPGSVNTEAAQQWEKEPVKHVVSFQKSMLYIMAVCV